MVISPANHVPTVYILSDSIGETGELVVRAAASQFDNVRIDIRRKPHLSSIEEVEYALSEAAQAGAAVVYTLVRQDLKAYLQEKAAKLGIQTVGIMDPVISALATITGLVPRNEPGLIRKVDQAYFAKVEAIEFAVKYDDGKDPRGLEKADIVIIGVSRTSKTPLCMYLAHKGIKAANVPLVVEAPPPAELFNLPLNKVIGLTIKPGVLQEIRKQRLKLMGLSIETDYVHMEKIQAEYEYAWSIMRKIGCTVIDVTNKSVEEAAANILDIYRKGVVTHV
ncbi:pyruvate, water dikinase regulatory protein [Sporomusa sp.]|uniref:pyruvate, water dikinase regulatory protein n=1 Tax=Sporomusa sp. TaxID=2078658 RepID=UPI002BBAA5C7|nr:pyruvate, water dikinase regulatory protein [Sporomusa sp.]HWR41838.1 pyruvate, water dikinase regulatory protein [Sporomusa sp.]